MGNVLKANDLIKRGFEYSFIRQLCHMEGSPFYQIRKGGTWRVDEDKLDRFFDRLAREKEVI